jgi:HKD family nuclease
MMKKFVLGEKLKEEINGKKVIAAFFTSFNFDPDFFENYLLPLFLPEVQFGDNKIQNTILWKKFQSEMPPVTVYCDFHAKSQKGIQLDYTIFPLELSRHNGTKPCFHSKHSYILLEDETLLVFVGSNNLTEAGWCSNLEGVTFYRLKPKENLPAQFKKQHWSFIEDLENESKQTKAGDILWQRFFKRQTYTNDFNVELIDSKNFKTTKGLSYLSILIQNLRKERNSGLPFQKIEIISPYFPTNIGLFDELIQASDCKDISISIPFENTDYVSMDESLFQKIGEKNLQWKAIKGMSNVKGHRFNHSKIYQFIGEEKVFQLVGSLNFTNMAWKGTLNGGNRETGIINEIPIENFESLLEDYPTAHLNFTGNKTEENHIDSRTDAFNLSFIIDWTTKELEIVNPYPNKQTGFILINDDKIQLRESEKRKLKDGQLRYLSNSPLITVRPIDSQVLLYYYPIHKNISSKPLPDNIRLNDSELLQLWLELIDEKDKDSTIRAIDRFINRITDESGELKKDQIDRTSSTLNLMATHLSSLLHLNKKIFHKVLPSRLLDQRKVMLEYYLFSDNVDTLLGYRRLLNKMSEEGRLNNGFHWLLLNILEKTFYKKYRDFELIDPAKQTVLEQTFSELKHEIRKLSKLIESDRVTLNHLKWAEKMIMEDAE